MLTNNDKPAFRQALGDDSTRGLDLALTPVVFGGLGWLVDRWVGTSPVFTIVFAAMALFSVIVKMWFTYDAEMKDHESAGRWNRSIVRPKASVPSDDVDLWSMREGSDG